MVCFVATGDLQRRVFLSLGLLTNPLNRRSHRNPLSPNNTTPNTQTMASFNSVTLLGNLTRDPDVRFTPQGVQVVDVSIALNHTWKDESGTKREEVTYVDCVFWSKLAEIAGKYLKKGSQVLISGRLHQDSWIDKNTGQKRSKIVVIAENLQMLGSRADSESGSSPADTQKPGAPASPPPPQRQTPKDPDLDAEPGDIPF
jgi:single-strand DNA-binding protein